MRLLQVGRLSRLADASTGLDKQDEAARKYAEAVDDVIVAEAADADVSGSVSPWKRPRFGPYLTSPALIASYDGIIAATVDRLGRSFRDLSRLRDWAEDHGKTLIVISPSLRWPPAEDDLASPIVWDILARLAEAELKMITKRSRETRRWLRQHGYLVGRAPWGFLIVDAPGGHKTLAPDPALVPYIRELARRYLAGESLLSLARWLTAEGIETETGLTEWNPGTVSQVLRNPALVGRRRDANGQTVLTFPGIVDAETWDALQRKLAANRARRGKVRTAPAMLTGILHCALCGRIMHRRDSTTVRKDGTRYVYPAYRCDGTAKQPSTCRNTILRADVDDWVNDVMSGPMYADLEVIERVTVAARGHDAEITLVEQDIRALDFDAPDYDRRHAALLAERRRLLALPAVPEHVEDRPTGETVAHRWQRLDDAERRDYLLRSGAKVYAASERRMAEAFLDADATGAPAPTGWTLEVDAPNVLRVA